MTMPLVVLISGRGSNLLSILQAIETKRLDAQVHAVVSNNDAAEGLRYAAQFGVSTYVISGVEREHFERETNTIIDRIQPRLVVLAGFMRVLSDTFVTRLHNGLINIHPSLLPKFPGLHTHRRALAEGVKEHGASVHLVVPEVDAGPLLAQVKVKVATNDTEQSLANKVIIQEHILYPMCLQWFAEERVHLRDGTAFLDNEPLPKLFSEFSS